VKVIHFVPYFPPERLGGVGEYGRRLHRALLEAGHESLVVTRGHGSEPGVERIARTALGWFLRSALWTRRCQSFDVVHTHAGEALPLLLALSLRRRRARILTTFHVSYAGIAASLRPYTLEGERFGDGAASLWQRTGLAWAHRLFDRAAVTIADAVALITRACATEVLGEARARDADVIYHGLPPAADPAPEDLAARVELLYVGRGGHRKRVHALPLVLAHVRSQLPLARLRIVGFSWSEEPALRRAFEARGLLAAVDCDGPVPSDALARHYRAADVLVVPSAYEGLPLVVVEAMQCGLPVVATAVSGHPEAVEHGASGYLVPLDDPRSMASRCAELLRDPELRRAMGARGEAIVRERFGMQRHLAEYLALYQRLCDAP
jgi:glycosyltransferase involved in cell wall biosynthesis